MVHHIDLNDCNLKQNGMIVCINTTLLLDHDISYLWSRSYMDTKRYTWLRQKVRIFVQIYLPQLLDCDVSYIYVLYHTHTWKNALIWPE